jgi:hypothetical protein
VAVAVVQAPTETTARGEMGPLGSLDVDAVEMTEELAGMDGQD